MLIWSFLCTSRDICRTGRLCGKFTSIFLHTKCTHMRKVAASSTPPPVCSVNPASCFFRLRRVLCWLSPPGRPLPTPGDQQPARHIYLSATGPFSEFTQIPLEYGWENKQSNSLDCSGRLALAHALSPLSLSAE